MQRIVNDEEMWQKFLVSNRAENYEVMSSLLRSCEVLGSKMSLKVHFLPPRLHFSHENLGDIFAEHCEGCH